MSPYEILGLSRDAPPSDIKAAFRKKIKQLHPDLQSARQQFRSSAPPPTTDITIHQLIEAYELLSDPAQREAYDRTSRGVPRAQEFNYRDWLKARTDPLSQAKLIFYDVLRDRRSQAVDLYTTLEAQQSFSLEDLLGKEDFMDCAFMLALEFETQGQVLPALGLYRRISELESRKPYFRHFFAEVEERLLRLLPLLPLTPESAPRLVKLLEEFQTHPFRPQAKAQFLLRQAEIYWQNQQRLLAQQSLERARQLDPKSKGLARIERQWRSGPPT